MSKRFRLLLFWVHLLCGVLAGLVIAVMSFTGAAIAFKPQLLEWAESDLRRVEPPPDATGRELPVQTLLAHVRAAHEAKPTAVTVFADPALAVTVTLGRAGPVYVNPYSGEVRAPAPGGLRGALHVLEDLHRSLALEGEQRPLGRAITGASNAVFLFLALSGLYLWWPRRWTASVLRPAIWFRRNLRGKARDWNWHNVVGFWFLPVLVVLTSSGMVISYRWASDLVFTVTGSPVPPANASPASAPSVVVPEAPEGARPLELQALLDEARAQVPGYSQVMLRLPGGAPARSPQAGVETGTAKRAPAGPEPVTFTVRQRDSWPRFASLQMVMDPFTAKVLQRDGFENGTRGRQLRLWMRFLHTGEALGWPGQLLAALASLGGVLLVWTGLALSWRRFAAWRRTRGAAAPAEGNGPAPARVS